MAVVFGIVNSNNGKIFVKSEEGKGSRFDIYLPVVERQPFYESKPEPIERSRKAGRKILLVDDEVEILRITSFALKERGFEVFTASNGKEALEVAKDHLNVDIVLLDMIMSEMDGMQAFVKIKQIIPKAKFLIISGYDEMGPAQEVLEAGADGFLQKPFEIGALLQKLNELQAD